MKSFWTLLVFLHLLCISSNAHSDCVVRDCIICNSNDSEDIACSYTTFIQQLTCDGNITILKPCIPGNPSSTSFYVFEGIMLILMLVSCHLFRRHENTESSRRAGYSAINTTPNRVLIS